MFSFDLSSCLFLLHFSSYFKNSRVYFVNWRCTLITEFLLTSTGIFVKSPGPLSDHKSKSELSKEVLYENENNQDECVAHVACKGPSYVPQSAIALRCRVMPPPCLKNPYIKDAVEMDVDPFRSWRTKCSGLAFFYSLISIGLQVISIKLLYCTVNGLWKIQS